ncbi:MAG TPA: hypothetical protein VJB35_01010 [Candidatus Nanoarchaeia archaeon]|nr:hypothetical protein [Candidatus Nanoarchaeia archaeon]
MNKKDLYRKLVREEELTKEEAKSLGDTRKANLDLPFKYIIRGDKYLGAPVYSEGLKNIATICSSKNNLVAKVSNSRERNFLTFLFPFFSKFFLESEFKKHLKVYNNSSQIGINAPKPSGLYNIYDISQRKFFIGQIMEKIDGETLLKYKYKLGKKQTKNYRILSKRMDYNQDKLNKYFIPEDLDERNVVIERRTNKIFYIDFELWKIK